MRPCSTGWLRRWLGRRLGPGGAAGSRRAPRAPQRRLLGFLAAAGELALSASFARHLAQPLAGPVTLKRGIVQQSLAHLEQLTVGELCTEPEAGGGKDQDGRAVFEPAELVALFKLGRGVEHGWSAPAPLERQLQEGQPDAADQHGGNGNQRDGVARVR